MLDSLLSPRSIALVGASADKDSLGYKLFQQLKAVPNLKFYPVNPKYKTLEGLKVFPDLNKIPGLVDQVIVAVPAPIVPNIAVAAVAKKVKALVVISAGFSETGAEGKLLEKKLKKIVNKKLILLGPNCFGLATPARGLNTTFAKVAPPEGNIAFVSQSGAIGAFLFDWAKKERLGFSKFVSLGNRAGVTETEMIDWLSKDPQTKVIGLYLESFADGKKFLTAASTASRKKPVVVLFGGTTPTGKIAAASHTASLSPQTDVIATALIQSGCIQAKDLDQFTDLLEIFSLEPELADNDLVIVTNAGGPGILAADATAAAHLKLDQPIDLLGDATAEKFKSALNLIIKEKSKDAFLIILTPQSMTELNKTAEVIAVTLKPLKKPVVVSLLGEESMAGAGQILSRHGLATIEFPQKAVTYLGLLYQYYRERRFKIPYPVRTTKRPQSKPQLLPSGLLDWPQISKLAKAYRLPLTPTKIINSPHQLKSLKSWGWPLVLKVDSAQAIHRTEVQGLYLNLKTQSALKKAYQTLGAKFGPVLLQPQLTSGTELFIGFKRELNFPPLLTLGSGGIYTEVYRDVAHAFLPLNRKLAELTLSQTKIGEIIKGVRGLPPQALKKVIDLIINASNLVTDYPQIEEMDINPALVDQNTVQIVDIKIKTLPPTHP